MRVTFYVAAFFAIICSLQHMVLAVDGTEDSSAEHEAAPVAEEVPEAKAEDSSAEHEAAALAEEAEVDEAAPLAEEKSAEEHEPDSEEYLKHMEELSAIADKENEKRHGKEKVPSVEDDKKAHEEMEKLMAAEAAESKVEEERKDEDAHLSVKEAEEVTGEDPPVEVEEEEEIVLPTKYPEINAEMTHVSLVEPSNSPDAAHPDEVYLTLEYSYFKGADKYEICGNCNIAGGKRINADTDGEVKTFSKNDPLFCETSPACFAEIKWKSGGHTFSMRAHTEKGWTEYSPNYNFHIQKEVGPVTHIHEDL